MNTIEEKTELSQSQGEDLNGKISTLTTKKITTSSSSSHNSATTSTTNDASSPTNASPTSPVNGLLSTSSSEDYLEDLKIISHLKKIDKVNERRRIFLSNSLTSEYQSDEKTESKSKQIEDGVTVNDTHYSAHKEKRTLVREQKIDNDKSYAEKPFLQKYATLPIKTKPSSITPPPKPPMLSRTLSIGAGDSEFNKSTFSPSKTAKFEASSKDTSTNNNQNKPTSHTIITSSKLAEPAQVTCIQLNDTNKVDNSVNIEGDTVALRSSQAAANMNETANTSSPAATEISTKHYERLIEELKCPGCAYPMKIPVYLCKTGHSVCDQCVRILLLCPLCKDGFTDIRSLTVEALCSKAHFKCQNAAGGCTVRLQIDLLSWHEKQCIYKPMKCFMGRVWGDCQWNGREAYWKDHLEEEHSSKVFTSDAVELLWDMAGKQRPLSGYYVFQVYNEMFNFYEVYDKERILFTMTCTSTQKEKKHQFAFEVTLISVDFEALSITQKFPVHSEYDKDILAEGTCISFLISDLAKFLDEERLLHYRVRVVEVKTPRKSRALRAISPSNYSHPIDFQLTQIQGVNLKNVPSDNIVTRKPNDIPFADNGSRVISCNSEGTSEDEIDKMKREYFKSLEAKKKRDSGSDTDPEFEAFIAKKWGTPQLHFNRKYLKPNVTSSDGSSSDEHPLSPRSPTDDKMSIASVSYKKRVSNTLRKSFRNLKTDLIEMKPFGKKGSPEKKSMND